MDFNELFKLTALSTGFTFLCTALGAAVVFVLLKQKSRIYTQLSLGFSAGIMLAAAIFSLLVPAI